MTLLALFLVAAIAAGFDAIAGGGGLLTLPALLLAGLDPVAALATNKVQSSAGATSATWLFARRGLLSWSAGLAFVLAGGIGAAAGALGAGHVPRSALQVGVPLVLIAVAAYFLLAGRLRDTARRPRLSPAAFAALAVAPIGFYDGIFGPGTGAFLATAFVALLGYGITAATAHAKLANAASNWGALAVFASAGHVNWRIGLVMAAGAALGGQVGSRLAIRHGARLIRPILVAMSCAMAARLLMDPGNPLRQALAAAWR